MVDAAQAQGTPDRSVAEPPSIKVLFIGNSYTYVNDLPGMLVALADSPDSPRRIQTSHVTTPGANLEELWNVGVARDAIHKNWDYVVLQDGAGHLISDPEGMARYARLFDAEIKQSGARTILFLPWAHKFQRDAQPGMNQTIYHVAKELGAQVAPIAAAWTIAQRLDPEITLYKLDARHPTLTGSYIGACVIYLVLMADRKTCPAIYPGVISRNEVDVVRNASAQAIDAFR